MRSKDNSGPYNAGMSDTTTITLEQMRRHFTSAVVCDALDAAGFRHQSPRLPLLPVTVNRVGSMLTPFFADGPVIDYATATLSDTVPVNPPVGVTVTL